MSLKRIPFIDEAVWELINAFLIQLHDPGNGGFHIYTESQRPNNLTINDVGRTIWNSSRGCFQRWSGGYWEDLKPNKAAIEEAVLQILSTWNPSSPPPWVISAINNAIATINMSMLQPILDGWVPGPNAAIRGVINAIVSNLLNTGPNPIPVWLTNYVSAQISSSVGGVIPLSRISGALDSYWNNNMLPYITGQDDLIKALIEQRIGALDSKLTQDINTKHAQLLAAINTHSHAGTVTGTTAPITTAPPSTPAPTQPASLGNVRATLTQRPGTMRVSFVPPYSQGSATGVRVVEAAFDISITYTGTGAASTIASTYYAPVNGYTPPSGERKVLGYGVTNIGTAASPYVIQNFYLPIATTSTATPRKTWKYYVIKGNDGPNYFMYDTNTNWNNFMSNYYFHHVEIPYGGFDTNAWLNFWDSLDANMQTLFPRT